jgi:hypothetical protein
VAYSRRKTLSLSKPSLRRDQPIVAGERGYRRRALSFFAATSLSIVAAHCATYSDLPLPNDTAGRGGAGLTAGAGGAGGIGAGGSTMSGGSGGNATTTGAGGNAAGGTAGQGGMGTGGFPDASATGGTSGVSGAGGAAGAAGSGASGGSGGATAGSAGAGGAAGKTGAGGTSGAAGTAGSGGAAGAAGSSGAAGTSGSGGASGASGSGGTAGSNTTGGSAGTGGTSGTAGTAGTGAGGSAGKGGTAGSAGSAGAVDAGPATCTSYVPDSTYPCVIGIPPNCGSNPVSCGATICPANSNCGGGNVCVCDTDFLSVACANGKRCAGSTNPCPGGQWGCSPRPDPGCTGNPSTAQGICNCSDGKTYNLACGSSTTCDQHCRQGS